ncbi:hypothetical protein [Acinetobacter johnsonii]|uniref:hypothetical protein n=1 Tax=Acinetobacter johnsonii TaxID=40214 RepID=UPI0010296616|nr:hypothetical protein [Acinetobacter johnsonii]RZN87696.1 hypothetical protein EXE24_13590 [Acinetobacter johnsonii]
MTNLISGKEALIALANGEEVDACVTMRLIESEWHWFNAKNLSIFEIESGETMGMPDGSEINEIAFRVKPRTITINGIEVPACGTDYKPRTFMFVLNSLEPCEYSKIILDEFDETPPYWWKSEDEIKQVVAALRQVFGGV